MTSYFLLICAVATSIVVAARRRTYRPIAALLAYGLASDVARYLLAPVGSGPYEGLDRLAFHVRQAFFLGWYPFLMIVAGRIFVGIKPMPIAAAYLGSLACLVLGYPYLRGDALAKFYGAAHTSAVLFLFIAAGAWWYSARPIKIEHCAVLILLVCEAAALLWGPWPRGLMWTRWDLYVAAYQCAFFGLTILQGVVAWKCSKSCVV